MRSRSLDARIRRDRRGAAALAALLFVPAVLAGVGVAVDAGHLFLQFQKVKAVCRSAALAAFEYPLDEAGRAGALGTAGLRMAGMTQGDISVSMDTEAGRAPTAVATVRGARFKTILVSVLSGGRWEWSLDGISAKATRRPLAVSLVFDVSGSMCNTRPVGQKTTPYLDAGDGMLPRRFYEDLRAEGGLDFLATRTTPAGVKYNEVPALRMFDPARVHTCKAQDADTWLQDYAREAKRFVRSYLVDGYDLVGIVSFNWGAYENRPLSPLDRAAVENAIDGLVAGGPTNLAAGIRLAADQLIADSDARTYHRNMILFTEGGANVLHARFTDVSTPASVLDPAFRYDPASPSPETPPSYVMPAATVTDGRGSLYKDDSVPEPREYLVLFNPSPFDRWVFEKKNPSDPEITLDKLKLADCAGPHYLHKYTPDEPPQGSAAPVKSAAKPYEPGQGGALRQTGASTIYGTYAIERCFDSYDYEDWNGGRHSSEPAGNGRVFETDLVIPAPNYALTDSGSPYPKDPYVAYYLGQGAKLLRYDVYSEDRFGGGNASRDLSFQPMQMALYEADRAKSPPNNITIHSLTYGFPPISTAGSLPTHNIYRPTYALNGNDYLSVKLGHRLSQGALKEGQGDYQYSAHLGYLTELTNYGDSHAIARPIKRDWSTRMIGEWEKQSRGFSVMFVPNADGKSPLYFDPINTAENDALFSRHSSRFFGYLTRQASSQTDEPR